MLISQHYHRIGDYRLDFWRNITPMFSDNSGARNVNKQERLPSFFSLELEIVEYYYY
jgi:hypothetical protein